MDLLEQLQQQAEKGKGVDYDQLLKAWQEAGAPKTPEKVYPLLVKALGGNKQAAADAFKSIGISFEKHKDAAQVLDKNTARELEKYAKGLSPGALQQMIEKIKAVQPEA